MRFIGDIHGHTDPYIDIALGASSSIQLGDFGVGMISAKKVKAVNRLFQDKNHKFIRGNHDNPSICKDTAGWIEDGSYFPEHKMMCIGGAWSIDRNYRTEGVNWWPEEELSIAEMETILDLYIDVKPKIMVTHDCPPPIAFKMFLEKGGYPQYESRTGQFLGALHEYHQPNLWVFGHWHHSASCKVGGTTFICLDELDYMDIDLEEYK